ncbi:hypothetical protein HK096_003815 [Nowakowskiella sp. JEL0078]|nr:hypothetical protein HK096_003815 [Nowakowskiella sp. JEL0078]
MISASIAPHLTASTSQQTGLAMNKALNNSKNNPDEIGPYNLRRGSRTSTSIANSSKPLSSSSLTSNYSKDAKPKKSAISKRRKSVRISEPVEYESDHSDSTTASSFKDTPDEDAASVNLSSTPSQLLSPNKFSNGSNHSEDYENENIPSPSFASRLFGRLSPWKNRNNTVRVDRGSSVNGMEPFSSTKSIDEDENISDGDEQNTPKRPFQARLMASKGSAVKKPKLAFADSEDVEEGPHVYQSPSNNQGRVFRVLREEIVGIEPATPVQRPTNFGQPGHTPYIRNNNSFQQIQPNGNSGFVPYEYTPEPEEDGPDIYFEDVLHFGEIIQTIPIVSHWLEIIRKEYFENKS